MFVDQAKIWVKAGDGGKGCLSFHRTKVNKVGIPDGGKGGKGGDVILKASRDKSSLLDFQNRIHFRAENGQAGQTQEKQGKDGQDLMVYLPRGTVVRTEEGEQVLVDLCQNGAEYVVARGGRGGRGNASFVSQRRRRPRFAEKGEKGEETWINLELRLMADVGIVGFPNVGKSTLLSRISAARPKIAEYPFTTLNPVLGVVRVADDRNFVVADIPGLIEGAHLGHGLGLKFLKHIERTKVILHLLDVSGTTGRDPLSDFDAIRKELSQFDPALNSKPLLVAANKIDWDEGGHNFRQVQRFFRERYEHSVLPVSALTGEGLERLVEALADLLNTVEREHVSLPEGPPEPIELKEKVKVYTAASEEDFFKVEKRNDKFVIEGKKVERLAAMTDLDNEEAVQYMNEQFDHLGVNEELKKLGIKEGDTVAIGEVEFEFVE
ncbi:GTPase [Candidatus Hakubella thermalkaliphila]|uniref:GTPase Obg n=1 Tax=Candidatus Hakubella thermalkaliphila TaxID=2754717 RepID=A0A6V8NQZ2_9ACTN|nr:GTPase ObgE [Candidatus Hakubella thermalkaliphila]GFP22819.1 GTPase [Candidatus Hakubella thermalkaliphila]GFP29309.1 GTPase [Candidatus Hakubella thermalkaliphila]GFP38963.1 GTPase [Candidatus Hakubella thermalkaliphila]